MAQRVAEQVIRGRRFGPKRLVRVDLHGVSMFAAGDVRALIRWEWVEGIDLGKGGVVVRSADETINIPSGCFGMASEELAGQLEQARDIEARSDVIRRLSGDNEGA